MNDSVKQIFFEVLSTIGFLWAIGIVILFLTIGGPLSLTLFKGAVLIGWTIGCFVAAFLFYHMKRSIEISLDMGENGAKVHGVKTFSFRILVVTVLAVGSVYLQWINTIALFAGLLTLKVAVYMQPFTHKYFARFGRKEDKG